VQSSVPLMPVQGARAAALVDGLRHLREQRLFCDLALVAEGESFFGHQVLLAAASPVFRTCFLGGGVVPLRPAGTLLPKPPAAMELQLGSSQRAAALRAMLDRCYSGGSQVASTPGTEGLDVFCGAGDVVASMQKLRASGDLCDLLLSAGGQNFIAHQCALAAVSPVFRDYALDQTEALLADLGDGFVDATEGAELVAVVQPMELDLPAIKHGDAIGIMLDAVYGMLDKHSWAKSFANGHILTDVINVSNAFELPWLADFARERLQKVEPGDTTSATLTPNVSMLNLRLRLRRVSKQKNTKQAVFVAGGGVKGKGRAEKNALKGAKSAKNGRKEARAASEAF